jgi:hypothetical protein
MKIPKEAKEITLAVLKHPELHYKACCEDMTGRPQELDCICPLQTGICKIANAEEN